MPSVLRVSCPQIAHRTCHLGVDRRSGICHTRVVMETRSEQMTRTHEEYLQRVREIVIERALERGEIDAEQAEKLEHTKLVYGVGNGSYRGACHYDAWENGIGRVDVVEIAATAEESWVQLAGTTIHELGHVLAGHTAGHGSAWKTAAERLGLRAVKAAGQHYTLAGIDPRIRERAYGLAQELGDGRPEFRTFGLGVGVLIATVRPCSAGVGTRGGKSRGTGSGSRMHKVECETCGYVARVARKWLDEGAPFCGADVEHGRMVEPGAES